jgi:hypothetical protein
MLHKNTPKFKFSSNITSWTQHSIKNKGIFGKIYTTYIPVEWNLPISKWEWETMPITVAARSKAETVFVRSNAGVVGSNSTQGMSVCILHVFLLFCV